MDPESVIGLIFSPSRDRVLLTQRRDVPVWVLPGGGVSPGEDPKEAVAREILEETGFDVEVSRLVGIYHPANRLTRFTHVYECEIIKGEASLSQETRDVAFFPLEKLPPLPPPYGEWIIQGKKRTLPEEKVLTHINYKTLFVYFLAHPILVTRFLCARMGIPINTGSSKKKESKYESKESK